MNPPKVPADWVQISEGDKVVPRDCNHIGAIERYDQIATCISCLAQWAPPEAKTTDHPTFIIEPPRRRCSQGHVMEDWQAWLKVGKHDFCLTCVEEKLPPLLDWLGIGRILPEEDHEQPRT